MLNQAAFTNLDEGEQQLEDFFISKIFTKNWPEEAVVELCVWVRSTAARNRNVIRPDNVAQFWREIREEYPTMIMIVTDGQPELTQGWQSVQNVLGEGADTARTVEQQTGITGALNLAQDQLEDIAEQTQKNKDVLQRNLPLFVGGGIALALLLLIR